MALYNLSEFIQQLKEDAEIGDLPLPVTDKQIIDNFDKKTLVDFSLLYPLITEVTMNQNNIININTESGNRYQTYKIPKYVYDGTCIVNVFDFRPYSGAGLGDLFLPNANWASPDSIISAIGDIRMAAGVASTLTKAPTIKFIPPDKIRVYHAWVNGAYEAEIGLKHPVNLSTVEPGCIYVLRELALLNFKGWLYGKLKRKDGISTGVGELDLKVSEWSDSAREYREKIAEYMEDSNLSYSHIINF